MKSFVLAFFFCSLGIPAVWAQTHTVKGVIHNEAEEVVPYAALSLFTSSDSTLSKTGVADGNGNFRLVGVPTGEYYLMASSVGHQPYSSEVFAVNKDLTLPRISMAKSSQNLEEVTITGTKPVVEVQADRTVFNVQQTLSASGSTGLELLRKAPGVIVDNNDNVILDGKSGVQVYLDGKPLRLAGQDLTDYLKGMSSDEIESIELITQPSARYEAAGSAGIINIVLKKDLRYGLRGSAEGGYGIGRFAKYNGRVSLSQRTKKFSMFGSYGLRVAKDRNFFDFVREQGNTVFDQASSTVNDGNYHQARAGVDYFASSKSTFGIVVNSTINDGVASTGSRTDIAAAGSDVVDQVLVAANEDDRTNYSVFTNLNYRFKDTLGNELSVDLDHGYYNSDRTLLQPNTYLSGDRSEVLLERNFRMITPVEIQILSAKADYEFTLGKVKVTTGAKVTDVSSENDFQFYSITDEGDVFDAERSNDFEYDERVTAGYAQFAGQFGKIKWQGGLRAEQTESTGALTTINATADSLVDRSYLDWFPSGGITYQHNQINSFALWYSKRITRPNYQSLNPFEQNLDELSFQKGNPFLQPQYTHNLKLSHTYRYTLNTSISYSYVSDFFAQVTDTIDGNRNFLTTDNVADQHVVALNVSFPFQVTKWWSVYGSVNMFYTKFTANTESFQPITRETVNFYGQNTFSLPKDWKFEVSGWFNSPGVWGGTYRTGSMGSLDLAMQKRFFDDKMSLRVAVTDVLFTAPWDGSGEFGGLRVTGSGGWESRRFKLSLRYNFGNTVMKKVRLREGGAEDASKRL